MISNGSTLRCGPWELKIKSMIILRKQFSKKDKSPEEKNMDKVIRNKMILHGAKGAAIGAAPGAYLIYKGHKVSGGTLAGVGGVLGGIIGAGQGAIKGMGNMVKDGTLPVGEEHKEDLKELQTRMKGIENFESKRENKKK